uniref:Flap endonuclease n=1 Tax=Carcinus maenas virus 1 TaxID=2704945 RepID=A0A6G9HE77_9VIRU|nr:flap endonuclease [Carcinus maenas virus 1]
MGIKGGVFSAVTNNALFIVNEDLLRGDIVRVYIDGTAVLYTWLAKWKNDRDQLRDDENDLISKLAVHYHEKLTGEIKKHAKKITSMLLNCECVVFSLAFDDRSRRPPNKEHRKNSIDIQPQVNSYIKYLEEDEEDVFGIYSIGLLPEDENEAGHGCCGENDLKIVTAIYNDDETRYHVIYSNDSDYFAFDYKQDQRLFFCSPRTEKVLYDLSHISVEFDYTLVPVAAIAGCDYGTPTILGKDKSELGKSLKELFGTSTSFSKLAAFNKMIHNHLEEIYRVGLDAVFNKDYFGGGNHCCEVDVLKEFVLYLDALYCYYADLQPFTTSSKYFNWKICRGDAYKCLLIYMYCSCSLRHDRSQMFAVMDRLFPPVYTHHYKVTSVLSGGEETNRCTWYVKEKLRRP